MIKLTGTDEEEILINPEILEFAKRDSDSNVTIIYLSDIDFPIFVRESITKMLEILNTYYADSEE